MNGGGAEAELAEGGNNKAAHLLPDHSALSQVCFLPPRSLLVWLLHVCCSWGAPPLLQSSGFSDSSRPLQLHQFPPLFTPPPAPSTPPSSCCSTTEVSVGLRGISALRLTLFSLPSVFTPQSSKSVCFLWQVGGVYPEVIPFLLSCCSLTFICPLKPCSSGPNEGTGF